MSWPDNLGLHAIWNEPTINCTTYEDWKAPGQMLVNQTQKSLCE